MAIVIQAGLVGGSQPAAEQSAFAWLLAPRLAPLGKETALRGRAAPPELTIDQTNLIATYKQLAIIASYTGDSAKAQRMLEFVKQIQIQIKAGVKVTTAVPVTEAGSVSKSVKADKPKFYLHKADFVTERLSAIMQQTDDDDKQLTDELSGVETEQRSAPLAKSTSSGLDARLGSVTMDDDNDMQKLVSEERGRL
jgi:hypothetical protein